MNYIPVIFSLIVTVVMICLKWYVGMHWGYVAPSFAIFFVTLILCHFNLYENAEKSYVKNVGPGNARKIIFDGHSYVVLTHGFSNCIIHDPSCRCQNKE